jgi:hypothetical protein
MRHRIIVAALLFSTSLTAQQRLSEVPTGFDNLTNGAITQQEFDSARATFESVQGVTDGLGPVFNDTSCVSCHFSAGAVGGSSQVTELRAGRYNGRTNYRFRSFGSREEPEFVAATVVLASGGTIPNRSLINQRAICPEAQSTLSPEYNVTATRISLSMLGDGYVEAVPDEKLKELSEEQARRTQNRIRGEWVEVPILEAPGIETRAAPRHGAMPYGLKSECPTRPEAATRSRAPTTQAASQDQDFFFSLSTFSGTTISLRESKLEMVRLLEVRLPCSAWSS